MNIDGEIEVLYRLWILALKRPEWFRNPKATRKSLDIKCTKLCA